MQGQAELGGERQKGADSCRAEKIQASGRASRCLGGEGGGVAGRQRSPSLLGSAGPLVCSDVAETRAERVNDEVTPASSRAKKNTKAGVNDKLTPCM